jgi:hypothetical protein
MDTLLKITVIVVAIGLLWFGIVDLPVDVEFENPWEGQEKKLGMSTRSAIPVAPADGSVLMEGAEEPPEVPAELFSEYDSQEKDLPIPENCYFGTAIYIDNAGTEKSYERVNLAISYDLDFFTDLNVTNPDARFLHRVENGTTVRQLYELKDIKDGDRTTVVIRGVTGELQSLEPGDERPKLTIGLTSKGSPVSQMVRPIEICESNATDCDCILPDF